MGSSDSPLAWFALAAAAGLGAALALAAIGTGLSLLNALTFIS